MIAPRCNHETIRIKVGLCIKCYAKEIYHSNPKAKRDKLLRKLYGITEDDYQVLLARQGGRCLICLEEGKLVVDHCHASQDIRGLLCNTCNAGLGMFKDRLDLLQQATRYLESASIE